MENVVLKFREGDIESFERIFHQFYNRMCAFSIKYVQQKEVAEEIVDDAFLVIWQRMASFEDIYKLKSYLYITVRNSSLDYLKKKGEIIPLDIEISDTSNNIEYNIIEEETHSMLFRALATLPAKSRKVFEMSCLDGIKYKDIADEMQISLNTVKSQRARALLLLKEYFKANSFYTLLLGTF